MKLYDTQTAAYSDLEAGRLDALVSDVYPAYDWMKDKKDYEFVGEKVDIKDQIAIAVRKDDAKLQSGIQRSAGGDPQERHLRQAEREIFPFDIY